MSRYIIAALFVLLGFLATQNTHGQGTIPPPSGSVLYFPLVLKPLPSATPTPTNTPLPTPTATVTLTPATGDIEPPRLVTWSFAPTTVNTSASAQVVTFTIHITDSLSGFDTGWIQFHSASRRQSQNTYFRFSRDLISGTAQDGIYTASMTLPRFSETGAWQVNFLTMDDNVGNRAHMSRPFMASLGLPVTLAVVNDE